MIYIKNLRGRFGNFLFSVATGLSLAIKNNDILCVNNSPEYNVNDNMKYRNYIPENKFLIYDKIDTSKITHIVYDNITNGAGGFVDIKYQKNMELDGYFMSYLHFEDIKNNLKNNYFNTLQRYEEKNLLNIPEKYNTNKEVVVIHVRLGDYLDCMKEDGSSDSFLVRDIEYYKNAIDYFLNIDPDINFFIISDNMKECMKRYTSVFFRKNAYFINSPKSDLAMLHDFNMMIKFDHVVMSSSTFSWWGAYLNNNENKKVIIPEKWFGGKWSDPNDPEFKNTDGFYIPGYIKL